MFDTIKKLFLAAVTISLLATQPVHAGSGLLINATLGGAHHISQAVIKEPTESRLALPLEKQCMAQALYHEARGEPRLGQLAVGATILNRVRSRAYPDTICGVVYQNSTRRNACQFSFACDGRSDAPRDRNSYEKVYSIGARLIQKFSTGEFRSTQNPHVAEIEYTHYHRHDVSPSWSKQLQVLGRIGDHVFFRSERVVRRYNSSI